MPSKNTIEQLMNLNKPQKANLGISPGKTREMLQTEALEKDPDLLLDAETGEPLKLAVTSVIQGDENPAPVETPDPVMLEAEPIAMAISPESTTRLEESTAETEANVPPVDSDKSAALHYTRDQEEEVDYAKDPRYLRIDNLPSKFICYPYSQVFSRTFVVDDWVGLTRAVSRENITEFLDVFESLLSVSVRDLAYNDFVWYMYWHLLHSFPKQPLIVNWMSRYGNSNRTSVSGTNLENKEIDISPEEYQALTAEGYKIPTVRDYEVLLSGYLTPEQETKYKLAQFLTNDREYPTQKEEIESFVQDTLKTVGELPTSSLSKLIQEIQPQFHFGITNTVELTDTQYDLEKWKQDLQRGISLLESSSDPDRQVLEVMKNQLTNIRIREEAGEDLSQPLPEPVDLTFSPWGFFPDVPQ